MMPRKISRNSVVDIMKRKGMRRTLCASMVISRTHPQNSRDQYRSSQCA